MSEATQLVRYDAMCSAITAAYSVDEVKDIRDKARAIEVYARQAKNVEAERQACEIRLRAERKAAQLKREEGFAKGTDYGGRGDLDGQRILPSPTSVSPSNNHPTGRSSLTFPTMSLTKRCDSLGRLPPASLQRIASLSKRKWTSAPCGCGDGCSISSVRDCWRQIPTN
jgi:hypothetical protein